MARQRVFTGVGNLISYDDAGLIHGSSSKLTAKSESLVAIQIFRTPAPLGTNLVGGRATTDIESMATCSGAFICTNSPLPSPPRCSAQVVSRSPSVNAAGVPIPLDAEAP